MKKSEFDYFRNALEERQSQISKNISGVSDEIEQLSKLELNDEGDYASANNSTMVENAIIMQQTKELEEINRALGKIGTSEYGFCEMCEEDIGVDRLKVKPHAIYCINCREIAEKSK